MTTLPWVIRDSVPRSEDAEDLLVYPWCGVIFNIDSSATNRTGLSVGPGATELKQHFSVFTPNKAHVFWGNKGHMGMGVITFRSGSDGLKDALAFEKWFASKDLSRRDWERISTSSCVTLKAQGGTELYGWLARKDDYEGRLGESDDKQHILVAKYLQNIGDLKDIPKVAFEEFQNLLQESEVARHDAEHIKLQLEAKHKQLEEEQKQELEELKSSLEKAKKSMEEHTVECNMKAVTEYNEKETLKKQCKDLEDEVKDMKGQAESNQKSWQLDMVNQRTEMQKEHRAYQVNFVTQQEEQITKLELWIQDMKLSLPSAATQRQSEQDFQGLRGTISTRKFKESAKSFTESDKDHKNKTEALDNKFTSLRKRKDRPEIVLKFKKKFK